MLKQVKIFKGYSGEKIHTVEYFTLEEIGNLDPEFVSNWYNTVKQKMDVFYGMTFPRLCLVCGDVIEGAWDAHHGIVSRNDVRGFRHTVGNYPYQVVRRMLIDTELNLLPLHHECHLHKPPTREEAWNCLTNIFTEEAVKEWYYSLPWKLGKPPRTF